MRALFEKIMVTSRCQVACASRTQNELAVNVGFPQQKAATFSDRPGAVGIALYHLILSADDKCDLIKRDPAPDQHATVYMLLRLVRAYRIDEYRRTAVRASSTLAWLRMILILIASRGAAPSWAFSPIHPRDIFRKRKRFARLRPSGLSRAQPEGAGGLWRYPHRKALRRWR
ncbi:hypothetical protein shim_32650 [Shimia sp. SK013]|nr:hypothetical protein shim_32650 [Shimia sp. SK013]